MEGVAELVYSSERKMQEAFHRLAYFYEGKGYFTGYNIPAVVIRDFFRQNEPTKEEKPLYKLLQEPKCQYLIAYVRNDVLTRNHELLHAKYYLNSKYRKLIQQLYQQLESGMRKRIEHYLRQLGYKEKVWPDELQAYLFDGSSILPSDIQTLKDIWISSI